MEQGGSSVREGPILPARHLTPHTRTFCCKPSSLPSSFSRKARVWFHPSMGDHQTELLPQVPTLVWHQLGDVTACKDARVKNKRKSLCSGLLESFECHQYNYVGTAHASSVFLSSLRERLLRDGASPDSLSNLLHSESSLVLR